MRGFCSDDPDLDPDLDLDADADADVDLGLTQAPNVGCTSSVGTISAASSRPSRSFSNGEASFNGSCNGSLNFRGIRCSNDLLEAYTSPTSVVQMPLVDMQVCDLELTHVVTEFYL